MAIRPHLFALSMTALHIGCPRSDPGSHADVTTSDAVVADDGAGDANDGARDVNDASDAHDATSDVTSDVTLDVLLDVTLDAARDVPIDPLLAAPRLLSPLSTATVASPQPTLRWVLPSGVTGAVVEVCAQRSCATVTQRFEA